MWLCLMVSCNRRIAKLEISTVHPEDSGEIVRSEDCVADGSEGVGDVVVAVGGSAD